MPLTYMRDARFYEKKAVEFLKLKGYRVLARNFRTRFGEIDVVAKDKSQIAFIEVKGRSHDCVILPKEAVDERKQKKLKLTAQQYSQREPNASYRFDVLGILDYGDFRVYELIKGAFE